MEFRQEDRDMLIAHDVKLGMLCKSMDKLNKDMTKGFNSILNKIDHQKDFCADHREKIGNRYFTKRVLMWIIGFIVLGVVGVGIYTGELSSQVQLNTHRVDTLMNICEE